MYFRGAKPQIAVRQQVALPASTELGECSTAAACVRIA